jgi:hypothetical protein
MFKRSLGAMTMAAAYAFAMPAAAINLKPIGTFETGVFDEGAAEIVAYDSATERVFVVNADAKTVDALSIFDPENPTREFQIDVTAEDALKGSGGVNSVAVSHGLVAVAVENDDTQANGWIAVYDTDGNFIEAFDAGALPDMVTFTPDGRYILAANEGEPSDDYTVDPEGSITIVDLRRGVARQATFEKFNGRVPKGVRITGGPNPDTTVAQDLEPEYIAVSPDGRKAWVALQENNALAVVDIRRAKVTRLLPLGTKDHNAPGNGLDVSNRDDAVNIQNWPVHGLYMPDAIAAYNSLGRTFIVTANEGDGREYEGDPINGECPFPESDFYGLDDDKCIYLDEKRIGDDDVVLDSAVFPNAGTLQEDENLGRLKIAATEGLNENGEYEALYSYGARSFSIFNRFGKRVFDSGDDFEQIIAQDEDLKDFFNSTNDDNDSFDDRSDDKGPEPEGVAIGKVGWRTYAFIGLERIGGIMVYDITFPRFSYFVDYFNNRDFSVDVCNERDADGDCETGEGQANADALDLGPEGLVFIPAQDSPTGDPLLVVGNEISGTTTIYRID